MLNAKPKSPVSAGTVNFFTSTQNSQITDKDTEKNGKCFNATIDSLGFGKSLSVLGKNDTIKYGSETLKPRIRKC